MIAMVETPAAVVSSLVQSLNNAKTMLKHLEGDFTAASVDGILTSVIRSLEQEIALAEKAAASAAQADAL
jgi:hypothetical protein